jgi:Ca-activated chloride channel homolog
VKALPDRFTTAASAKTVVDRWKNAGSTLVVDQHSSRPVGTLDSDKSSGIIGAGQFGGKLIGRSTPKRCHSRLLGACAAASVLLLAVSLSTPAQQGVGPAVPPPPEQENPKGPVLKAESDLTLVYVTVTEPTGRLVTGLEQSNFRVYEDGKEQEIVRFASEDVPVSIGVIFDMSGSMGDKIDKSKNAAVQFLLTANPQDEFFLVDFNDRAQLVSPFTASVDDIQSRLMYVGAHGLTALYDGVYLGLSQMKGAHNRRKALLIISDGGDNHSRYGENDVRNFVQESDVQIYAIGLYEPDGGPTPEERNGPSLLNDMTHLTGGRTYNVRSPGELPDIATKISQTLRNQYVIGYRPSNGSHDGKWRKIKVQIRPPKGVPPLSVYAKTGYYAPGR